MMMMMILLMMVILLMMTTWCERVSSVSDTDSLSQGSSVGSLCLEDDEDRNSLKSHFDTLASGLSDGTERSSASSVCDVCSLSARVF